MSRTLADVNTDMITLYGTRDNTYDDFPIGTHVKIICCCQDFYFFYGETGKVIKNSNSYLGIIVEFNEPRHFEGGHIQTEFNFVPTDLAIWNENTQKIHHEQERLKKMDKEEKAIETENTIRSKRFEIMDL